MACADKALIPPSPVVTEYIDGPRYPSNLPKTPLLRSAFRVGIETPRQFPLVRVTAGGGMIASHGTAFFGTAAIGIGTRSERTRVFAELETNVARTRVETVYTTVTQDGGNYSSSSRKVSGVDHPGWTTLHLGVELPLSAKR